MLYESTMSVCFVSFSVTMRNDRPRRFLSSPLIKKLSQMPAAVKHRASFRSLENSLDNGLGTVARMHFNSHIPEAVWDSELFRSFEADFRRRARITKQIASFEQAVRQQVSDSMDVIRTDSPIRGIGCKLCPHLIFVRRRVHDALLGAIRRRLHTVLIGNPGIGKSVFQQYYLARIFNENLYGSLPADYFGSTSPPEVVVRQIGARSTELYFVPQREHMSMKSDPEDLLDAFDPQRTVLLFEPGEDLCEPAWYPEIPTSAFVSPNLSRYKEFVKRGAVELYNPVWDLDEILDIAQVMRTEPSFPDEMQGLYTESAVKDRYDEFGGILRYCLPQDSAVLRSARRKRRAALQDYDKSSLIQYETIEHSEVSQHLAQFKVEVTGPEPFENATIDLLNDNIKHELWRSWLSVSLSKKIRALMRNDETVYMDKACQDLYEDVVAANLLQKMPWRQRLVSGGLRDGEQKESFSSGSCSRRVDGSVPKFADMEEDVLYVPLKSNFPLGDMVWKCGNVLHVANATRQSSGSKLVTGVEAFVNELDVPSDCRLCLYIVPKHDMYNALDVKVPLAEKQLVKMTVMVLEMPKDYGASRFGY